MPSLIYFGDVFCLLPSDLFHKKKREESENKNQEMRKGKMNFLPWTFWFWIAVKRRNQKKNNWKRTQGSKEDIDRKEMRDEERRRKEEDGLMHRMSRGRDQWQVSAHRPDSLTCVATRSNGQESLQSRTRSSTRANLERSFFFCSFFDGFYFVEGNSNY